MANDAIEKFSAVKPRIDPLKLLTCLKVLLAPNGGIRSANEVKRLAELMAKYSKKLVSKCIYIQILKSTDTELLGKFMGVGGWLLTHMWLNDAIKAANWPLVQEILELLLLCPVDVQRLRSNTAPKLVKGLSKDGGNEGVRILATKLVEQWLKVVKGETMAAAEGSQAASINSSTVANGLVPGATAGVAAQPGQKPSDQSSQPATTATSDAAGFSPSKTKSEDGTTYKIIVKDGKQILAKIVAPIDPSVEASGDNSAGGADKGESGLESSTDDKLSNKENESQQSCDSDEKDSKEMKDKDSEKDKSKSSKDKDRHRDHKSSSSSSRHKSSSSSKPSSKSSSSSSKSKSSHSSSSSSKHKDKEGSDKERHKSSSSSSKSSSSSSKDKDKERDKSKSRDKDRDREKSRSSSEKDKSRSDRDREKEREKSDKDKSRDDSSSRDKDKVQSPTEFDRSSPMSIDKLGKIPKKPKEEEPLVTSITIPSKKASMSIEIRRDANRPKTVKTYNSQFRSHGLSEEAPPPPSRKGLKKPPPQSIPGTSIPPTFVAKRASPPPASLPTTPPAVPVAKELLPPAEKKLKIDLTTAPATEKPGAVKFIAPKPKPSTLIESDMFMDALSAAAPKKDIRKRKRRPSASKEPGKEPTTPEDPDSPVANKVTPLKFYQDTLEDSDKLETGDGNEDFDDKKNEDEDDIPLKKVKEQIEEKVREEKELEERRMRENEEPEENPVKKPPGPGCGPDGPPGVLMLHRRKGPKKKLTWRTQEQLEEVRYFELDENERVNVTKTFTDMKQMERFNEREAFMLARKINADDVMVEQTPWTALIEVDDVPPHPEGMQSKEKKIQMERELTTLKALYFNRHMIPDSAAEPDMEQYQITEPAVIPLDDITGNPDAVNDFTSMPWPDPKGSPPPDDDFMGGSDMGFPGGQFNPFMPFGGGGGWMGPGMNNGPPNGMMPSPIGGPMGNFNPMMGGPGSNMMMNPGPPPNMMMGGPADDMGMNCNMNMMNPGLMGPGGPGGPNFGGMPNGGMGGGFNNFGPPMGMNPNAMNMNMNNGPPRGGGGGPRGGNWRSGTAGPPGGGIDGGPGGGNWRGGGRGGGPGGNNNPRRGGGGRGDNRGICKQFQRGFCRNGNNCNYYHPPGNPRF